MLYTIYIMAAEKEPRKLTAIRLKPSAQRAAKVAAVIAGKTLGQWLEEAIREKVQREGDNE